MSLYPNTKVPAYWQLLMSELNIPNPAAAALAVSCFADYASELLAHQAPNLLDPHFPDIQLRINLALSNGGVGFSWTDLGRPLNPADYAVIFVIRVVQHAAGTCAFQSAQELLNDEFILKEAHVILCKLQSIWSGSDSWVEGNRLEPLRAALLKAMESLR